MGMIGRMVQPGVIVTLHTSPPSSPGSALVKSRLIPLGSFSEGTDYLINRERVDMDVVGVGNIRYAAAWIENQLEGVGKLRRAEAIDDRSTVFFPRGELRLKREDRR